MNDRRIVVLVGSKRFNRNWPDNQTCSTKFAFILSDTEDGSSTVSRICSPPNERGRPTPAISVLRKLKVILLEPLALPADVQGLCLMKIIGSGGEMCWLRSIITRRNPEHLPTSQRQFCFRFAKTTKCCADWLRPPTIKSDYAINSLVGASKDRLLIQAKRSSRAGIHNHRL